MEKIIKNAVVIFYDGKKERYNAIRIKEKGLVIGKYINNKFEPFGYIPNHSFKKILKESIKKS